MTIAQDGGAFFDSNIKFPSGWIVRLYSNWLLKLQKDNNKLFKQYVQEMSIDNNYIIMGEINEPWMEHIVPINDVFIEVYTVLDNGSKDGLPIHCKTTFDLFNKYKMAQKYYKNNSKKWNIKSNDFAIKVFKKEDVFKRDEFMNSHCIKHVKYSIHPKNELDSVINIIREETNSEGSVLYLLNDDDNVIGLCKVKASSYVVRRRIRERCRNKLFRPLSHGKIMGYISSRSRSEIKWSLSESQSALKSHLRKGMSQMNWVPNYKRLKTKWSEFAIGFVDWWIEKKLGKTKLYNMLILFC